MRLLTVLMLLVGLLMPLIAADEKISDDVLYDQIRLKLANDRAVGGDKIDVSVNDGNIVITGKVRTEKNRERVEKIVKKVKGVKSVVNRIQVSPV